MSLYYAFHKNGVYEKVNTSRIKRLESDDNHTLFHMEGDSRPRRVTHSLGYFATHPHFAPDFVRVNRQFMVRWEEVAEFSIKEGVKMKDNKTIYQTTHTWLPEMRRRCGLGKAFIPKKQALKP